MTARAWALFAAVSLLWGVPYLFIGVALDEGLGPFTIVAGRVALGALVLLPPALRGGLTHLLRTRWRQLGVLAAVEVVVPFLLITVGQQTVSSAVTGVLIATVPMFVLLFGLRLGRTERLPWMGWTGLAAGFVGVVVLLGVQGAGSGVPLVVTAAACYGLGALLISRWFAGVPTLTVVAGMLVLAAPVLALAAAGELAATSAPASAISATGLLALLVLGVACTAGGFSAFFALVAAAGPARAALITYVAPVVAVVAGALVLAEVVTARTVTGIALVLLGAAAAGYRPRVGRPLFGAGSAR